MASFVGLTPESFQKLDDLLNGGIVDPEAIAEAVHNELVAHPEWTTTVPDNSLNGATKFIDGSVPDAKLAQTGGVLEKVGSIFSETPVATSIREIAGATAYMGWNGTVNNSPSGISISSATPGYDSYLFITTQDMDIWFGAVSVNYLALTWGTAYTETVNNNGGTGVIAKCSNPVRLRTSDGNLPTEQNKLHVPAGSAVCFTLPQGKNQDVYGFDSALVVRQTFADEVHELTNKQCMVMYETMTASEMTEKCAVFVPSPSGYVRYDFVHSVAAARNCDVWRMYKAFAVDDNLRNETELTTAGEWECAVRLHGAPDFSGGSAHGDEVVDSILFLLDGVLVDITSIDSLTEFDAFTAVQVSTLYDPNDNETEIAKHGSEHVFTSDGLQVNQTVTWSRAEALDSCYLAMLPASKAVTNRVFTDKDYVSSVADGTIVTAKDAHKATLYDTTDGVVMTFSIGEYPKTPSAADGSRDFFLLTDNTADQSGPYNKCYFVITTDTTGNVTVAQGDEWKASVHYNIVVGSKIEVE